MTRFDPDAESCPECGSGWKYKVPTDQPDCTDPFCDEPWPGESEPKGHNAHCASGGERGPFSRLIGVTDINRDAIGWWRCPFCDAEWDRWTGELLERL